MGFLRLAPAVKKSAEKDEAGYLYSYNIVRFHEAFIVKGCETGVSMAARIRAKKRSPQPVNGLSIPAGLHEAIEIQRGNLARAESVLGCLVTSMEYETESANKPYYPDVAQLARELVRQSINGLDSLMLQKHLLRNKIREYLGPTPIEGAYPVWYY
jgi:hypothetical protein